MLSSSRLNLLASVQSLPRDLRLLFLSLFLWTFGLGLYNYIWPLYLRDLQASPSDVGIVFSIGFLALALSMIPGGILANKYELKALLIIGWAMSIPPPLMYYFARTWTDVIPGIILLQVSGFNIPAFNAYIAGTAERTKSASNFGITWASAPLGVVFSPLVGSALLNWISVRDIFILTFVFFSISTMVLFFMKPQPALENDAKAPRLEFPKSRREGTLLLYLTGAALAWSVAAPFIPLYFQDALSLGPSTILLLGALQSLGAAIFAILLGRRADAKSRGGTMALGLVLSSTGLIGVLLTRNPLFSFPLVFLIGSARAPSLVGYSILSTVRKGASRAGQFGFFLTLESLGFVIGSYLGGILYTLNPTNIFYTTSTSFIALALLAWLSFRSKAEPAPSEPSRESEVVALSQNSKSYSP
ncbi:MFS transporter [Candidatus Bathyarchaeota archaeon]|nr:MAG: MFS transporter [Candidatus Bathyarchaeota archaeon]